MKKFILPVAAAAMLVSTAASAHMGLVVDGTAAPGTSNLFAFAPGHDCEGVPTTAIKIAIPAGIENVKAVPKPGWEITFARTAENAVTEVHFTGNTLVADQFYDRFWIRARINAEVAPETMIHFPVIQECGATSEDWIQIPVEGQDEPDSPAPGFEVHAAAEAAGHGH